MGKGKIIVYYLINMSMLMISAIYLDQGISYISLISNFILIQPYKWYLSLHVKVKLFVHHKETMEKW